LDQLKFWVPPRSRFWDLGTMNSTAYRSRLRQLHRLSLDQRFDGRQRPPAPSPRPGASTCTSARAPTRLRCRPLAAQSKVGDIHGHFRPESFRSCRSRPARPGLRQTRILPSSVVSMSMPSNSSSRGLLAANHRTGGAVLAFGRMQLDGQHRSAPPRWPSSWSSLISWMRMPRVPGDRSRVDAVHILRAGQQSGDGRVAHQIDLDLGQNPAIDEINGLDAALAGLRQ